MANKFTTSLYGDNPTQPRAEIYPSTIIIPITLDIAAGATVDVFKEARGIFPTTFSDIVTVTRSWLGFSLACQSTGGALRIRLTSESTWLGNNLYNVIPIYFPYTNVTFFELPDAVTSLQIVNLNAGAIQGFNGTIIIKAV